MNTRPVVECDIPASSVLDRRSVEAAYFRDSYRSPLSRVNASVVDAFVGIFAHHPLWMKLILIARNWIATYCGLDAPTASEIMNARFKSHYTAGEKIGVWPIFSLSDTELIAGRDNKHLDFRLSVLCVGRPSGTGNRHLIVSTVVHCHNRLGRLYIRLIAPFHRLIVQASLRRAARVGWPLATQSAN